MKTAICKVKFDGYDWRNKFEVISPTGKRIFFEISFGKNTPDWTELKEMNLELYEKLSECRYYSNYNDVEFTYEEMRLMKSWH